MSLLAPNACVVCFHDAHPNGACGSMDDNWPPYMTPYPCDCAEYVTEEQRGQIVVPHVHEYRCSCGQPDPHVAALDDELETITTLTLNIDAALWAEALSDPAFVAALAQGKADVAAGRVRALSDIRAALDGEQDARGGT